MGFLRTKPPKILPKSTGKNLSCEACGLYKNCISPKMESFGEFKKGIMNIGEMPSLTDDVRNSPWQGRGGRFLSQTYREFGINLFEDCINLNAINCFSDNKKSPTSSEINNCRRIVFEAINKYRPKIIVLFGQSALMSVIGDRWKKELGTIEKWRGFTIPDQDLNAWICPTLDPLFVSDVNIQRRADDVIWKKDIKKFLSMINTPIPKYIQPEIEIITDLNLLNYQKVNYGAHAKIKPEFAAFDYETTGIKPHAAGHRIVCASVAYSENHAYVFMMPETKKERQPFIDFLLDEEIKKIIANMKYERTWSEVRLKTIVKGLHWDTMLAAHQLDNRTGVSGLKFQNYVNFGVSDYSSEIEPYLHALEKKNANSMNRIFELIEMPGGKEKLLTYCGYDSVNAYRLAKLQMPLIKN